MSSRREFIKNTAVTGMAMSLPSLVPVSVQGQTRQLFDISLAEWSLNRRIFGGEISNLDFPVFTRNEFDIGAVEYVNQFFMDKAEDSAYLAELNQRCKDNGVISLLIMCDNEGALGDPDNNVRTRSIENHYKWITAAATLGCHSIRVNAQSQGSYGEQLDLAVDGLSRLGDFAAQHKINVIVENHGGLSSNGKWLAAVIEQVGMENCGTLPDFGNFRINEEEWYDYYQGVRELMPYAKGVSAKTYDFDENGNSVRIDYDRMIRIVMEAHYHGHIGIEWEGREPGDIEGIKLTKALLERIRDDLSV